MDNKVYCPFFVSGHPQGHRIRLTLSLLESTGHIKVIQTSQYEQGPPQNFSFVCFINLKLGST